MVSGAFTVTEQVAVLPFAVVAVIVAVPSFIAETTPAGATVHVIVLSVAFSGVTLAVKVSVPSISNVISVLFSVTLSTGITAAFTVTVQVAVLPFAVFAVIIDVPF